MLDRDLIAGDDDDFASSIALKKIIADRAGRSTSAMQFKYKCPHGSKNLADMVQVLNPVNVFQYTTSAFVEMPDKNFMTCGNARESDKSIYWMRLVGDYEWIKKFRKENEYTVEEIPTVTWNYMLGDTVQTKDFEITKPHPVFDEYYPYIPGGVKNYFDKYFKSDASILILIGEPGTGKTSILRNLIWERKLKANITFDEKVMAEESYFVDYAASDEDDIMIVEDADLLLSSRDSDQNKLMAKLLNVSDGLIRLDHKKMIFSTNLSNINRIDTALIRSGRCFDVLHFRSLTRAEALEAAEKVGVTLQNDKNEMTLAEVFNSSRNKDNRELFKLLKTA